MNIPGIRTQHLGRWDPEQSLLVLQDFLAMAHTHSEPVGHGAALLRLGLFVACAVAAPCLILGDLNWQHLHHNISQPQGFQYVDREDADVLGRNAQLAVDFL